MAPPGSKPATRSPSTAPAERSPYMAAEPGEHFPGGDPPGDSDHSFGRDSSGDSDHSPRGDPSGAMAHHPSLPRRGPSRGDSSVAPLVLWLEDCTRESQPLVGGKAVGLGALLREGLQVPP